MGIALCVGRNVEPGVLSYDFALCVEPGVLSYDFALCVEPEVLSLMYMKPRYHDCETLRSASEKTVN